jgi:UDP-N-acetylglucosamine 1-carboxyvinyltransferase
MDRIRLKGGNRLNGEIPISGAKNAALPLMAASLLTEKKLTLMNSPWLADVGFMGELLRSLGVETSYMRGPGHREGGCWELTAANITGTTADYDLVRKMRASFLVLGPLLARFGKAKVSLPGGCAIGARPVDLHLKAMEALGAEIVLEEGYVLASAPDGLRGGRIEFPFVSVGATENALMAAALARGQTVLVNAAREPEIVDLGRCLNAMGARISGMGT